MFHSLFKNTKASSKPGHSDKDKDSSQSKGSRPSHSAGHHPRNQGRRRLVRSQNIQILQRHSDDDLSNDASRSSLFSTEQSLETVSVPTWPCDTRDSDGTAGYSTDSASSDGSFEGSASRIFSAVTRHSEGDSQSLLGTDIGSPAGVLAGFQMQDKRYTNGLQIHTQVDRVQKSAPNSTRTSPVSSPKARGSKESQSIWHSASNNLPQGSGLTMMGSSYEKSTWTDAHPLPPPPTLNTAPVSPRTSLPFPRSSMVPPHGSIKSDSGPAVSKWQKGRLLGSGAFGRVYKGIHCETGEFCAIKEVEYVEDDPRSRESAKQLEQEIMLLSSLRHPNIVHYKGSEMVDGHLNIYLELVTGGSIYKLAQEFGKLEEPVIRRYTRQILHGLHFLHSRNTVHRDIKGANILVDQEGIVKLADFGMAKQIKQQGVDILSFKGSPNWMAPEVIMQKQTGVESAIDIWSLGCTVLEMATGKPPWSEYEGVAAMFKVTRAEIPPLPQSLSLEGQSFIKLCLQRNASDRPSAAALLHHPFVQIPNDGPVPTMQAVNIPVFLSSDVEGRSSTQQNSGSTTGPLRGGSHPIRKRQISRIRLRPDVSPSRSAPVSPRFRHNDRNELYSAGFSPLPGFSTPRAGSPRRTGFSTPPPGSPRHTGFSTPPGGSPRAAGFSRSPAGSPRGTGFDFYANYEQTAIATGKSEGGQLYASNRLPSSSVHNVVNRSDSPWDVEYDNRQIPHEGNPRSNGVYGTVDGWSYAEEEQHYSRKTFRLLQQMDEKLSQVFLEKLAPSESKA